MTCWVVVRMAPVDLTISCTASGLLAGGSEGLPRLRCGGVDRLADMLAGGALLVDGAGDLRNQTRDLLDARQDLGQAAHALLG